MLYSSLVIDSYSHPLRLFEAILEYFEHFLGKVVVTLLMHLKEIDLFGV